MTAFLYHIRVQLAGPQAATSGIPVTGRRMKASSDCRLCVLSALILAACSNAPTSPADVAIADPRLAFSFGSLSAVVNVVGDPSTGPASYSLRLDGIVWKRVAPGHVVKQTVRSGSYALDFNEFEPPPQPCLVRPVPNWCSLGNAGVYEVVVAPGQGCRLASTFPFVPSAPMTILREGGKATITQSIMCK